MSVEANPPIADPIIDLTKYLMASLIKDAYFQYSKELQALVRQDMGVGVMVQVIPVPEEQQERTIAIMDDFIQNTKDQTITHIAYNFIFILPAPDPEYTLRLAELQHQMDEGGLLADVVTVDAETRTAQTVDGRQIADRKLRKAMTQALAKDQDAAGLQEEVLQRRRALRPDIQHVGPNPIVMILLTNILIFVADLFLKAQTGTAWFQVWGIQDNALIRDGEVWRLITSMFLHADFAHLAGNMLFLYYIGRILHRYYTHGQLWLLYFVAGLVGNLAGFIFTDYLSLGASGAIMGLGGVLVYRMFFGEHAKAFRYAGNFISVALMIVYNLVYGLVVPGIDNYGHFGGFFAGLAMAALLAWHDCRRTRI